MSNFKIIFVFCYFKIKQQSHASSSRDVHQSGYVFCNNQITIKYLNTATYNLHTGRNAAVRYLTILQVRQVICVNASQPNVNARHIF